MEKRGEKSRTRDDLVARLRSVFRELRPADDEDHFVQMIGVMLGVTPAMRWPIARAAGLPHGRDRDVDGWAKGDGKPNAAQRQAITKVLHTEYKQLVGEE